MELLASDYRGLIQDGLALIIIACAFVWGGGPERVVAVTWLIVFEIASWGSKLFWTSERQLEGVDWFFASSDFVAGFVWISVALYANRNYTLWIAAMQVLAMTAHLVRGFVETISPITYVMMVYAPGWFQLLFLAAGLTRHVMRKRKYGDYRDWRVPLSLPKWFAPST